MGRVGGDEMSEGSKRRHVMKEEKREGGDVPIWTV